MAELAGVSDSWVREVERCPHRQRDPWVLRSTHRRCEDPTDMTQAAPGPTRAPCRPLRSTALGPENKNAHPTTTGHSPVTRRRRA